MDLGLTGRTALVFGASKGLGLACAVALQGEGANVVMVARDGMRLRHEAERIGATAVSADITNPADLERAVATTMNIHHALDIVIINGGGPPPGPACGVRADQIRAAVDQLLVPTVRIVDLTVPHLRASDQPRILLIASASVREPIPNLVLSNAVRPGVLGYLKTLASELGPENITVNALAPGRVMTDRMNELYGDEPPASEIAAIPLGRFGAPEELGSIAAFMCSSRASYLTGITVPVDGGQSRGLT